VSVYKNIWQQKMQLQGLTIIESQTNLLIVMADAALLKFSLKPIF